MMMMMMMIYQIDFYYLVLVNKKSMMMMMKMTMKMMKMTMMAIKLVEFFFKIYQLYSYKLLLTRSVHKLVSTQKVDIILIHPFFSHTFRRTWRTWLLLFSIPMDLVLLFLRVVFSSMFRSFTFSLQSHTNLHRYPPKIQPKTNSSTSVPIFLHTTINRSPKQFFSFLVQYKPT